MEIAPTILVPTYAELQKQLKKIELFFDYAQLDIMDGEFVDNKSFNYNEDRDLSKFFNDEMKSKLKYELHLMVKNPLAEIEKWKKVKSVFRVIFHIESDDNLNEVIAKINGSCWQAGIALNPETPVEKVMPYMDKIKMILFMTVTPGKQGNKFLPEVGENIKKITLLIPSPVRGGIKGGVIRNTPSSILPLKGGGTTDIKDTTKPLIAADGGINAGNIALVKSWGVEVFNIGSALVMAGDIEKTYKTLRQQIEN